MKQTRWILAVFAVILWAGCGGDDSTSNGEPVKPVTIDGALVVPAEWAGTWEITLTMKDCVTDAILSQEIITSQICPGDTLTNPFAPLFEDCQGTQTGNHLEAELLGAVDQRRLPGRHRVRFLDGRERQSADRKRNPPDHHHARLRRFLHRRLHERRHLRHAHQQLHHRLRHA